MVQIIILDWCLWFSFPSQIFSSREIIESVWTFQNKSMKHSWEEIQRVDDGYTFTQTVDLVTNFMPMLFLQFNMFWVLCYALKVKGIKVPTSRFRLEGSLTQGEQFI